MQGRIRSLLACYSVGAACCFATAIRADEPGATAPSSASLAVVAPEVTPAPRTSACDPWAQACCESRAPRFYVTGEYLMWWLKDSPQPVPLVTAVPAALVPAAGANLGDIRIGSLSDPNATVVLGGRDIDTGLRSGARFTAGMWLDDDRRLGVEGSYFFIAPTTVTQSVGATGSANSPLLSVPFFDVTGQSTPSGLPGESARPIPSPGAFTRDFPSAIPGETAGVFSQRLESRLQGFEVNALLGLSSANADGLRLEAVGGFRYLSLRESLSFSSAVDAGPLGLPDVIYNTADQFTARNDFYGGQLGLRGEYRLSRVVVQATAKVALGDVNEQVRVNGVTLTNLVAGPGTPLLTYPGGLFAQPSNIGTHSRDRFAVLPEADVNVGYQVFSCARVSVGYSFLYLSNVARPGNEINRALNVTRIPFNNDPAGSAFVPAGPAQPAFNARDSSFWAQGLTFGLEVRY